MINGHQQTYYKRTASDKAQLEDFSTEERTGTIESKAETTRSELGGSEKVGVSRISRKKGDVIKTFLKIILFGLFFFKYRYVSVEISKNIILVGVVTDKGFKEMVK